MWVQRGAEDGAGRKRGMRMRSEGQVVHRGAEQRCAETGLCERRGAGAEPKERAEGLRSSRHGTWRWHEGNKIPAGPPPTSLMCSSVSRCVATCFSSGMLVQKEVTRSTASLGAGKERESVCVCVGERGEGERAQGGIQPLLYQNLLPLPFYTTLIPSALPLMLTTWRQSRRRLAPPR